MPELNLWAAWIGILLGMITGAGMGLLCRMTDVFDALHKFVEDAAPFDVQITYLTPFPNTPLYHQLKREGRLTHDGQWDRCPRFDINYQPTPMTADELRRGFLELTSRLYNDSFTNWRKGTFRLRYLRDAVAARARARRFLDTAAQTEQA